MILFEMTVPQFEKALRNLDTILVKAAAFADSKKIESHVLMATRLYPNMLTLTRQIQIACDFAKSCSGRVAERNDIPKFEDNEVTIADARERIAKTLNYLQTFKPAEFAGKDDVKIPITFIEGKYMPAKDYVLHMTIPNFYFHITTAYAILRSMGVELGKGDYIGDLPLRDL